MTFRKGPLGIITLILVLSFSLTGSCAGEVIAMSSYQNLEGRNLGILKTQEVIAMSSYQNPIALSNNNIYQTPPLFLGPVRSFVFRTDFLDERSVKVLKGLAGKVVETPGGLVYFNKSGWPKFDVVYKARLPGNMISDPSITDTALRNRHVKEANRQLLKDIKKNPELAEKFSQEQIESIARGKTPQGYVWHHNQVTGEMDLVLENQHEHVYHSGGIKRGNFTPKQVLFMTSKRWAIIALADWVLSVGYLTAKDKLDIDELKKTTTGVVGAWIASTFTETAMNLIPRMLPFKWLPPLMTFNPAALTAGATYFITRFAISKLWDQIEIEQARRVEIACLAAESQARWAKSRRDVSRNNNTLKEIFSEILE